RDLAQPGDIPPRFRLDVPPARQLVNHGESDVVTRLCVLRTGISKTDHRLHRRRLQFVKIDREAAISRLRSTTRQSPIYFSSSSSSSFLPFLMTSGSAGTAGAAAASAGAGASSAFGMIT